MVQRVSVVKVDSNNNDIIPLDISSSGGLGVNAKTLRASAADSTAHRSTVTAADMLGGVSTAPTIPTFADATAAPSSALTAIPYYGAYVVRNGMGVTMASAIATVTPTSGHMVRMTIPAAWGSSLSDTDLVYEIFMSADAAPKHVATFTGAQLAASGTANHGCYVITAETPVATRVGAAAAWAVDIGVVGANAATTAAQFAQSTAFETGAVTPVVTTGYNNVDVFIDAQMTAYTTVTPVLILVPVYLNDKQGTNYHLGAAITISLLGAVGQSFRQRTTLTTNGASVMMLVQTITNVTINRIDIVPTSAV